MNRQLNSLVTANNEPATEQPSHAIFLKTREDVLHIHAVASKQSGWSGFSMEVYTKESKRYEIA